MDGEEMNEQEINHLKKVHAEEPEMILNPEEFSQIRNDLREALPSDKDIPNPDLFNTALLNRIEREDEDAQKIISLEERIIRYESAPPTEKQIIKYPWGVIAAGMAACLVFGFMLSNPFGANKQRTLMANSANGIPTSVNVTPVVYSAHQNVTADFIDEGQTNVIIIEGLEAIPDDLDLFSLASQRTPIKVKPNKSYNLDETN